MRVACASTSLFQKISSWTATNTAWPRFCAARIIVTVVSLYALSESGGSTTNRIRAARLLALFLLRGRCGLFEVRPGGVRHESHRARHFQLGERGVAAFRRHALGGALDRGLHQRLLASLDERCPFVLVADLGRLVHAGAMAGAAGGLDDRL